jgi:hypothetical protein
MQKTVLFAAITCSLAACGQHASAETNAPRKFAVVELGNSRDVKVRLRYLTRASLADRNWMSIEIENLTDRPVVITHTHYTANRECFDLRTGRRVAGGSLASGSKFDMYPEAWITQPVKVVIQPGIHRVTAQPSDYSSALLGLPPKSGLRVLGSIALKLEVEGLGVVADGYKHSSSISLGTPFAFDWVYPDAMGFEAMRRQLHSELSNPVKWPKQRHLLAALLAVPQVASSASLEELIDAMARLPNLASRDILLRHCNEHFANAPQIIAWYQKRLESGDASTLTELARSTNIWQDSFVPPIVQLFTASRRNWHLALRHLEAHGVPQQRDQALARRLAKHIYTNAPLKSLDELERGPERDQDAAFQEQGRIITYLGMTRDQRLVDYLTPWLDCRRSIYDLRRCATPTTTIPERFHTPPLRICDAALDALLRIEGDHELHEHYKARPEIKQFEGTTEDLITTINKVRDGMIHRLKQRRSVSRK